MRAILYHLSYISILYSVRESNPYFLLERQMYYTIIRTELFAVHTRIELVSPKRQSGRIAITPMTQL